MTTKFFLDNLLDLDRDLKRFAYQLTTNKEESNDLVQETYLKALRYCNKFTYDKNMKAWAFTIMKNTFINNYRRYSRNCIFSTLSAGDFNYNYITADTSFHPESSLCSKEIQGKIESLKDELKKPFKMHYEGFSYKEIAESLDLRLGTVKSRIFMARKHLMKQVIR
jgi:RNA polymerase sigma-70 factor (ECF subfamily)